MERQVDGVPFEDFWMEVSPAGELHSIRDAGAQDKLLNVSLHREGRYCQLESDLFIRQAARNKP